MLDFITTIDWFEFAGLVSGLLCVWLLIRQNVWTFPVGILYVLISLWVFAGAKLYADVAEHLVYLALNAYGWWYWLVGGARGGDVQAPISRTGPVTWAVLASISLVATLGVGWLLAHRTDASLPYWDSGSTALAMAAMWLTSRKKIENWYLWFVVDVLYTGIYLSKGLVFYTVLYLVYIGMAVVGYLAWKRELDEATTLAATTS